MGVGSGGGKPVIYLPWIYGNIKIEKMKEMYKIFKNEYPEIPS
jgi:hypothetical protein